MRIQKERYFLPVLKAHRTTAPRGGFTLIELLVVVGIIAAILAFFATAFKPNDGLRVKIATTQASQALQRARTIARAKNTQTKVLIHIDDSDPERFLRYILVTYLNDEGAWVVDGSGVGLEQGVYFDRDSSISGTGGGEPTELTYANVADPGAGEMRWLAYTFTTVGSSENGGARMVFAPGIVEEGGVRFTNPEKSGGFVVARSGRSTLIRDPNQLKGTYR